MGGEGVESGGTLERREVADGFELTLGASRVVLRRLAAGVVRVDHHGLGHAAFSRSLFDALGAEIEAAGHLHLFVDTMDMYGYEPEYRRAWSRWLSSHLPQLETVQIAFESRIVQMGIRVVSAILGRELTAVRSREAFDRAVRGAVERAGELGACG